MQVLPLLLRSFLSIQKNNKNKVDNEDDESGVIDLDGDGIPDNEQGKLIRAIKLSPFYFCTIAIYVSRNHRF